MAFINSPDFEDDFRKVGPDATAGFATVGTPSDPTEHAGSENIEVAGAAEPDEDEDLEDDEDLDDEEDEDDEDDLEDDDEDEEDDAVVDDEDDEDEDDLDEDDEDDDEDEDDLEEDDDTVKARLGAAEKRVRTA